MFSLHKGKPPDFANSFARELSEMPDYSTSLTRETENRLGPFVFEMVDGEFNRNDLISRGPFELDNLAIYHG